MAYATESKQGNVFLNKCKSNSIISFVADRVATHHFISFDKNLENKEELGLVKRVGCANEKLNAGLIARIKG